MQIQVTENDIKKGIPGSAQNCPVSLAIKRKFNALGRVVNVYVFDYIHIFSEPYEDSPPPLKIEAPSSVWDFVTEFDNSYSTCRPFAFDLPI